eukprot:16376679-Heterocapsa_arctica.AAC.1
MKSEKERRTKDRAIITHVLGSRPFPSREVSLFKGCIAGDSGCQSYHAEDYWHFKRVLANVDIGGFWENMTIYSQSGGSYEFWISNLKQFIDDNQNLLSLDSDGIFRFPITVPCIIIDNLNCIYHKDTGAFIGMPAAGWIKVRELFVLMGRFRSRFCMCTASASRWGLGSGCDITSARCREFAKEMNIPCWSGE